MQRTFNPRGILAQPNRKLEISTGHHNTTESAFHLPSVVGTGLSLKECASSCERQYSQPLYGTCSVSGLGVPLIHALSGQPECASQCRYARQRSTIVAIRCDTPEETGTQQERALKMPGNALPPGRQTGYPARGGGSALTVVVIAAMRTRRANPFNEYVSGQCTPSVMA